MGDGVELLSGVCVTVAPDDDLSKVAHTEEKTTSIRTVCACLLSISLCAHADLETDLFVCLFALWVS